MIGADGFQNLTSRSQAESASKLRHAPMKMAAPAGFEPATFRLTTGRALLATPRSHSWESRLLGTAPPFERLLSQKNSPKCKKPTSVASEVGALVTGCLRQ